MLEFSANRSISTVGGAGRPTWTSATAAWKNWQRVRTALAFQGLSPGCLAGGEGSRAFGPQLAGHTELRARQPASSSILIRGAQVMAALTTKFYVAP